MQPRAIKNEFSRFLEAILTIEKIEDFQWHGDIQVSTFSLDDPKQSPKDSKPPLMATYSVPENQREKLEQVLKFYKLSYEQQPLDVGRFGFTVLCSQLEERWKKVQNEGCLIYFLSSYIQYLQNYKEKHGNIFRLDDNILFMYCPTSYYMLGSCLDDRKDPHVLKVTKRQYRRPGRRDETAYSRYDFTNNYLLCALILKYSSLLVSPKELKELILLLTMTGLPNPLMRLISEYFIPFPDKYIEISKRSLEVIPSKKLVPLKLLTSLDYAYLANQHDIDELMKVSPPHLFDLAFGSVAEEYIPLLESQKILFSVLRKLVHELSDEKQFPKQTITKMRFYFVGAFESEHPLFTLKLQIGYYNFNTYCVRDMDRLIDLLNLFWKGVSEDKKNPYYEPTKKLFCCEAYEKEFGQPFPAVLTMDTLNWLATKYDLTAQLEHKKESARP